MIRTKPTAPRRIYASRDLGALLVDVWASKLERLGHPMDAPHLRDMALRLCRLGVDPLEAIETLESAMEIGEARR